jgi:hypothetical protein
MLFELNTFVYNWQGTNTPAYIFLASMMFELDAFVCNGQGKNTLAYNSLFFISINDV